MAQDLTSGFDLIVQISENELNGQLAAAFSSGESLPTSISTPFISFGLVGQLDLNLRTPIADMDRGRPNLGLNVPFADSQLAITSPVNETIAPLGGFIDVVAPAQVVAEAGTQQAVLEFRNAAIQVTATFDAASVALLQPILDRMGITIAQAQDAFAQSVAAALRNDIERIPLTPVLAIDDDPATIAPFRFEVTTVNDTTAFDRDALTFGIRTSSESGGSINNVQRSFIPAGSESVLMMSNFWLLAKMLRPMVAENLGTDLSNFDTPLRLNSSIVVAGGEHNARLRELEARVVGDRIRIDGRMTASGTGWSATGVFRFFVSLEVVGGELVATATEPVIDISASLEWWVWLLSLGLGAIFGGITGVIVSAIVTAILIAIAEGIAEKISIDAFNSSASSLLPTIPLGPIGTAIDLSTVVLDDLELRGPIMRSASIKLSSQGSHQSASPFTIDLDTGAVRTGNSPGYATDLICDARTGITTHTGSGVTVTNAPYGSLTLPKLERMTFSRHQIAANEIPISINLMWFVQNRSLVFGALTNQGRMAKVRAWRTPAGELHLSWITFDRPQPSLDLATRWSIVERDEPLEYSRGAVECKRWRVERQCLVEALPRLMAFPVNLQWCLCGKVIADGEGTVDTPNGTVSYNLQGRRLVIRTEMGADIDCELCVSAIDARQREMFTCIRIAKKGTEVACRKCHPVPPVPPIRWIVPEKSTNLLLAGKDRFALLNEQLIQNLTVAPRKK